MPINHRPAEVACDGGNNSPGRINECLVDADCPAPDAGVVICSCAPQTRGFAGTSADVCIPANCLIDSDCPCGYCSPSYDLCGPFYGFATYECHTKDDACINDGECDGGYCAFMPQVGHWACSYGFCAG